MLRSVLIANRGEIARRIIRTAKLLGVETIAVYSDIDEKSLFVQDADRAVEIGEARPKDSYLNIEEIIAAARECGATAIHPGYGFLSERWEFAHRCETEGLIFVGPSSEVIREMGDKYRSRQIASDLGIPIPPGSGILSSAEEAKNWAAELSFPIIFKASAIGWKSPMILIPKMSARLAPILSCITALCLRSAQVITVARPKTPPITTSIFARTIPRSIHKR